jgi:hypothetical protein
MLAVNLGASYYSKCKLFLNNIAQATGKNASPALACGVVGWGVF